MAYKKTNTRHPPVDPPFEHLTQPTQIAPNTAQKSLAKYLSKSTSKPHLHPDSFLSNTGMRFAIGSGPKGGVALHHLRRIEAGLRGEFLEKETPEQLEALFGDQWRAAGDEVEGAGGREQGKRKRKRQEIEDWVSTSSSQARPEDANDVNDQYRGYVYHHHEIESFANTPLHRATYEEEERRWGEGEGESEDPYYHDLNQRVWTRDLQSGEGGAVGTLVRQSGEVPEIVQHDRDGNVVASKAERKMAKKARREGRKMELARWNEVQRVGKVARPDGVAEIEEKEARKAEKKAFKEEKKRRKSNGTKDEKDEGVHEKEAPKEERKKKRRQDSNEGFEQGENGGERIKKKAKRDEKPWRDSNGAKDDLENDEEHEKVRAERKKRKQEKREKKEKKAKEKD